METENILAQIFNNFADVRTMTHTAVLLYDFLQVKLLDFKLAC